MSFLNKLLSFYQLTEKDLAERNSARSFTDLKTPYSLPQFNNVIDRILLAKNKHEKVVIYGDYDVDGLTSVTILKSAFNELNIDCGFYIPSRYKDGYGLNSTMVKAFYDKGYSLIIAVDNGISCFEAISYAKSLNMEVIIIDHHEIADNKIPETNYIFHQFHSQFLDYNCSAASLSFFVASKLLNRYDEYFASLAGIAVFSDVMPLRGNNLIFAQLMKEFINKNKYLNLKYILNKDVIEYDDISFSLIPSLNAIGRVCKDTLMINNACRFLIEKDNVERIKKIGDFIILNNNERKQMVKNIVCNEKYTLESDHAVCFRYDNEFSGLAGLIANKVMTQKNLPTLIFFKNELNPEQLVGSIRVPDNYSMSEFLVNNSKYFIACGGHKKACGVTIKESDYYLIATLFASECAKQALDIKETKIESIDLFPEEINEYNYHIYEQFMPFGEEFKAPTFHMILDKKDLIINREKNIAYAFKINNEFKAIIFNANDSIKDISSDKYDLYGSFSKNTYYSKSKYQFYANKIIAR